jgi:hypothetical protein
MKGFISFLAIVIPGWMAFVLAGLIKSGVESFAPTWVAITAWVLTFPVCIFLAQLILLALTGGFKKD